MVMHAETPVESRHGAEPSGSVFSLTEAITANSMASYGSEIADLQVLINKSPGPELIVACVQGLKEALKELVGTDSGSMEISLPKRAVGFARAGALIDDYEVGSHDRYHRLLVPMGRITAASALAAQNNLHDYRPLIDMRVQTSHDQPTRTYSYNDGRRSLDEVPNTGKWHRFPISLVEFRYLKDI